MYNPKPINTENVVLSGDILQLAEVLAQNTHEVWAKGRIAEGWVYGKARDDAKKETPCLVEYECLPEEEKEYDRKTALEALKLIIKLGYVIKKRDNL